MLRDAPGGVQVVGPASGVAVVAAVALGADGGEEEGGGGGEGLEAHSGGVRGERYVRV